MFKQYCVSSGHSQILFMCFTVTMRYACISGSIALVLHGSDLIMIAVYLQDKGSVSACHSLLVHKTRGVCWNKSFSSLLLSSIVSGSRNAQIHVGNP